jgi:hypothetical protein
VLYKAEDAKLRELLIRKLGFPEKNPRRKDVQGPGRVPFGRVAVALRIPVFCTGGRPLEAK